MKFVRHEEAKSPYWTNLSPSHAWELQSWQGSFFSLLSQEAMGLKTSLAPDLREVIQYPTSKSACSRDLVAHS